MHFHICCNLIAGTATATPKETVKPAIVDGKLGEKAKNSSKNNAENRSKTSTIRPKRAASTRRKLSPVKKSDTNDNTTKPTDSTPNDSK